MAAHAEKDTDVDTRKKSQRKKKIILRLKTDDITETWTILRIAQQRAPIHWRKLFQDSIHDLKIISQEIEKSERRERIEIVPRKKDIFNAFHWTPLHEVKVVIMGQDPYPTILSSGKPQATGASFSTPREAPIQPSLRNIYQEVKNNYPHFDPPDHGDLRGWAQQGVLLLNSALSTHPGKKESHIYLWLNFVKKVFKEIMRVRPKTIVLLWGRKAEDTIRFLGNLTYLTAGHPSPLNRQGGFIGCEHFKKVNDHLIKSGIKPVNWTKL